MVAHPRKTPSPGPLRSVKTGTAPPEAINQGTQFRSLNLPVPIEVAEDVAERPVAVTLPPTASSRRPALKGRSLPVASINDLWQVDDEWWRESPISRRYYQITTQNDRRLTIFQDQLNGNWYWQKGG